MHKKKRGKADLTQQIKARRADFIAAFLHHRRVSYFISTVDY